MFCLIRFKNLQHFWHHAKKGKNFYTYYQILKTALPYIIYNFSNKETEPLNLSWLLPPPLPYCESDPQKVPFLFSKEGK